MSLGCVTVLVLLTLVTSECPTNTWLETGDSNCYLPLLTPPFEMPTVENSTKMCEIIEETAFLVEIYNEHDQAVVRRVFIGLRTLFFAYLSRLSSRQNCI